MERWPDRDGPWKIAVDWKVINGRIEPVGIHLTPVGKGQPVTSAVLRDPRIPAFIRRNRARMMEEVQARAGRPGVRRDTFARMQEAARVYKAAYEAAYRAGRKPTPTKAVAEHFGISPRSASSLVYRARAAGLLLPTSPGAPQV